MRLILLTLFAPARAAEQLKLEPRWLSVFLFLSIVSVATQALLHPHLTQATLAHLPATATVADRQLVVESLEQELPAKLAFAPVRLFLGWGLFSAVLFYVSRVFASREPLRIQQMFSIEVHAEATSVLSNLVVLALTLSSTDGKPADLPLSLGGLFPVQQDFVVKSLLTTLNLFTLWYIVVLTFSVSTLCRLRKLKSLLVVLLVWIFSIVLNLSAIKLMKDELHLLL